jgi:hypothetical protein
MVRSSTPQGDMSVLGIAGYECSTDSTIASITERM